GARESLGSRQPDERLLVVVRHHADDVRELAQFVRTARRVTAGDDHCHVGVAANDSPDRLTRTLIRRRRHRAGVDDDKVGVLWRHINSAATTQLFFNDEGVGLVHAAAESHDGVLHSAFRPMSWRNCIPSKLIRAAAVYAVSIAARYVAPRPTTVRTLPPEVTRCPFCCAVPAWKITESGTPAAASRPEIGLPVSTESG